MGRAALGRPQGEARARAGAVPRAHRLEADPEPAPKTPAITTFERYVEQRLALEWKIAETRDAGERDGWQRKEHSLESRLDKEQRVAWAHELRNAERTWVLLGVCSPERLEKEARAWRRCAESVELGAEAAAAVAADAGKWTRFYERNPAFRNPRRACACAGEWSATGWPRTPRTT